MPAALAYPLAGDRHVTRFATEPEAFLGDRIITHPRGRVLGGTSSINGMMYVRGHPLDFDRWAQEGCTDWSFADVAPYFERLENCSHGEAGWRGTSGPIHIKQGDATGNPLNAAFLEAAQEAGYGRTIDINGSRQEGAGVMEQTIHNGTRQSTANAFLRPALSRKNLSLLSRTKLLCLVMDGNRAVGIRVEKDGIVRTISARSDVILATGAFASPHLLLLSGIGPPDQLRAAGVKTVVGLPGVGENLHDHPDVVLRYRCPRPVSLHRTVQPWGKAVAGLRWFLSKNGPAATNHFDVGAFIRSEAGIRHPDLQLSFLPLALAPGAVQSDQSIGEHGFQVHIDLVQPKSRGRMWITSDDANKPPRVRFNYLQEVEDRRRLANGIELSRAILAQRAMKNFLGQEITPGPEAAKNKDLDGWLTHNADTAYHPVGACRMGIPNDPMAVVDPQCRVIGTEGLRVVDLSVMPSIVSGNTNAATIMIAERAADMIRGRMPLPPSTLTPRSNPHWKEHQK